jgi:hypothetical protein
MRDERPILIYDTNICGKNEDAHIIQLYTFLILYSSNITEKIIEMETIKEVETY